MANQAPPPPVLEHPMVPRNIPLVVTRQDELHCVLNELRSSAGGRFAYDTEFIGEHSYHPKICVIQVATAEKVMLIDPLARIDLNPFWELLADPALEKIVHAGQQDLEPVVRHLGGVGKGVGPRNVFDTQIAAAFIGLPYPGAMGKLVQALLNADVGPGLKFSQWDHRPLSPVQVQYAANDVRYLPLLRQTIACKLEEAGNMKWAIEECTALSDPSLYEQDEQYSRVRIRGADRLRPKQRAVLDALIAWRQKTARAHDLPPRTLLKDQVLFDLAVNPASSFDDLDRVRGLPRPVENEYGDEIVKITQAALAAPISKGSGEGRNGAAGSVNKAGRYDYAADRPKVERLWEIVQQCAAARSITPAIVTSKKELAQLFRAQHERSKGGAAGGVWRDGMPRQLLRLERGWRRELLGDMQQLIQREFPSAA